ncbi:Response regulator receiver domain-containing protein [Haloplanus vescus]|uniref:Response regulator receiver domain-containing protein n=1 Tax=Haloplanus vescus TaxID=555874 RepID=A0A1H3VQ87_9EURY|nr:response regulator [Haloplanus vescus]SDZ76258.1 Response regulator receiver domain-containing protein [Haloplanus vescus]
MSPNQTPTDTSADRHSSQTDTVLVADDDDAFRETLTLWLADSPWQTRTASSGSEALSKLDDSVDAMVLDRRMPDLSGPEVIDRLDDTPFEGPVVVLSAFEPDDHLDDSDAAAYLTKPVDSDDLVETLSEVQ